MKRRGMRENSSLHRRTTSLEPVVTSGSESRRGLFSLFPVQLRERGVGLHKCLPASSACGPLDQGISQILPVSGIVVLCYGLQLDTAA